MPRVSAGDRFGKWEVLENGEWVKQKVMCRCDCGTLREVCVANMTRGVSSSCGCVGVDRLRRRSTHGHTRGGRSARTRSYSIWAAMKTRCTNKNSSGYYKYGAKGVRVCQRWMESFENFFADMGDPPDGCSIDRIDSSGNYEPGNCRWATALEQARNHRILHWVIIGGERMCAAEAAERYGVNYRTLISRLNRGIPAEQAVGLSGDEKSIK